MKCTHLVSLDYQISLYLDIDAEELSDFSSQRRNYSELATILNRKYAPQDDSFFSNLFKVFLAWYVFVIGKWLLKKAYFRDVQARRLRRKEKKIWIILKKIMKWAWKVILAFCFIFVIICIYLILDYNGEDYTDSTNFWLVEWIRFVLHALPALLAKAVKIGEIAIPIVLLFFMYRYFWVFPRQKRKIYTESFTPENTERDREFKRASSTPMDRFIEKVQNKKKSKYFYRIEELLLLHLPELWRRDILNGLRLAVKIFFYFLLASVFFTGMVTILRNNGIISPKFMYQALAVPNICTFFFPLIIWLIFVPLKKNIGQVVQQARYTFFNFSRERILFVFLLFVGGFFLSCFHVNRYAIYTIGTVATKSMEGFDDFYTRILQTSPDKGFEEFKLYTAIQGEYYFASTYDNLSDSKIIDRLYLILSPVADTIVWQGISHEGIQYAISRTHFEDSTQIISRYHDIFSGESSGIDTTLSLILYRQNLDEIAIKVEEITEDAFQFEKETGPTLINIYSLIIFIAISLVYFVDISHNDMKIKFSDHSVFGSTKLRNNWPVPLSIFLLFFLILFFNDLFLLWLILFAIITFPHIKYEIYKANYAPKESQEIL